MSRPDQKERPDQCCATCLLWEAMVQPAGSVDPRIGYCRYAVHLPIWVVSGKRPVTYEEEGENCPTYVLRVEE